MVYTEITWIFVCSIFLGLFVAYGIGANDVANSFGTSVGAGALTMKQALLVASICEFCGAVFMGSGVTETIRDQIADLTYFQQKPDIYAYGMMCSMLAAGIWLLVATYYELPVSTTHAIVGAVVGMTMVSAGPGAVNWAEHTDSFPFLGGVSSILLSWLFSPLLTAVLALVLFVLLRTLVLRSPAAYRRAFFVLPVFVFATFFMNSMYIIQQGGSRWDWDHTPIGTSVWISVCVGAGCTVAAVALQYFVIRKRVAEDLKLEEEQAAARAAAEAALRDPEVAARLEGAHDDLISDVLGGADPLSFGYGSQDMEKATSIFSFEVSSTTAAGTTAGAPTAGPGGLASAPSLPGTQPPPPVAVAKGAGSARMHTSSGGSPRTPHRGGARDAAGRPARADRARALQQFQQSRVWSALTHGANFDIHEVVDTDDQVAAIHYHSERFDWKAESVFKYLQVFTACANSFAHGSNDVSNSVGPLAAVYFVWLHSNVAFVSYVPVWILAVGGVGLVIGLATYGYKIMRLLGVKMTRLTNSRGFIVEISSAAIVVTCSKLGLPVSTTHCLVGAVSGIGLLEGRKGFNWQLLLRFFVGWVATLVVAGVTAAAFTAQGIYSPNNNTAGRRYQVDQYLQNTTAAISGLLAGTGVPAYAEQSAQLNASLAAFPHPLLDVLQAADLQLQALLAFYNATTWVLPGNGTA